MGALPDKEKVEKALNKICSNKLFKRTKTNELLLRFLVEQAFLGNDVKEQVIGLELFNGECVTEQNDSKIRVSVYHLRKKLEAYYADDGKEEEIIFEVAKGQYNLTFKDKRDINNSDKKGLTITINIPKKYLPIGGGVFLLLIGIFLFQSVEQQQLYCWDNFLSSKPENICVISDHYVVGNNNKPPAYSLYNSIKSDEDLIEYIKQNPDEQLRLSKFTLFSKMAPFAVQNLMTLFGKYQKSFHIRIESEVRFEDYKDNNVLFVGQAKNMMASKYFYLKDSKKFKYIEPIYIHLENGIEKKYTPNLADGTINNEYALVSFVPLENMGEALFFTSEHDIGVLATVKYFTNLDWLEEFYTNIPQGAKYFNALFEVEGIDRNDVSCKLIAIEIVE
ncbi:hypothetical protein OAO55_01370 [Bacteroidales bacterium]|nr:hypothetical protein [Bacteroidales bacterium]